MKLRAQLQFTHERQRDPWDDNEIGDTQLSFGHAEP